MNPEATGDDELRLRMEKLSRKQESDRDRPAKVEESFQKLLAWRATWDIHWAAWRKVCEDTSNGCGQDSLVSFLDRVEQLLEEQPGERIGDDLREPFCRVSEEHSLVWDLLHDPAKRRRLQSEAIPPVNLFGAADLQVRLIEDLVFADLRFGNAGNRMERYSRDRRREVEIHGEVFKNPMEYPIELIELFLPPFDARSEDWIDLPGAASFVGVSQKSLNQNATKSQSRRSFLNRSGGIAPGDRIWLDVNGTKYFLRASLVPKPPEQESEQVASSKPSRPEREAK